jgi:hypothetical protein
LFVGLTLIEQFSLNAPWDSARLTNVVGLLAAFVCLPVPFVAIRRFRHQFILLSTSRLEGSQVVAAENSVAMILLATNSSIAALVFGLIHIIHP